MQKQTQFGICQIHSCEFLAVDLAFQNNQEQKFLCSKCLSEKLLQKNSIEWIPDVKTIVKDIKLKSLEQRKKLLQDQVKRNETLGDHISKLLQFLNESIGQIQELINQRTNQTKSLLANFVESLECNLNEEDFEILAKSTNGGGNLDSWIMFQNEIQLDTQFLSSIKSQFQKLFKNNEFIQLEKNVHETLLSNIDIEINDQTISQINIKENKILDLKNQKSLYLPFICEKHGNQYSLADLEQNNLDQRLLCLECLPESKSKLTTLKDVNHLWKQYQLNKHEQEQLFLLQNFQKQQQLKVIIGQLQKQCDQFFNELFQEIENQDQEYQNKIKLLIKNNNLKSLEQLQLDQIKQILDLLAQKQNAQLMNQELIEKDKVLNVYYSKIYKSLSILEQQIQEGQDQLNIKIVTCQNKLNKKTLQIQMIQPVKIKIQVKKVLTIQKLDQQNLKHNKLVQQPMNSNLKNYFTFIEALKHPKIVLGKNGKYAKQTESIYSVCICDKPIQTFGITELSFKIIMQPWICSGVCIKSQIKQDLLFDNYSSMGHGYYFLSTYGQFYSYHDKSKNSTGCDFSINPKPNDIVNISVNYDLKKITWKNLTNSQTQILDIQTTSDLYFCFCLFNIGEIELL